MTGFIFLQKETEMLFQMNKWQIMNKMLLCWFLFVEKK